MPPIDWTTGLLIAAGVYALASAVSFVLYGWDKLLARFRGLSDRMGGRVPEAVLHEVDLLGGWPGGRLGQRTWRHKTQKDSFARAYRLTVIGNGLVAAAAIGFALTAWHAGIKLAAMAATLIVVRFTVAGVIRRWRRRSR